MERVDRAGVKRSRARQESGERKEVVLTAVF